MGANPVKLPPIPGPDGRLIELPPLPPGYKPEDVVIDLGELAGANLPPPPKPPVPPGLAAPPVPPPPVLVGKVPPAPLTKTPVPVPIGEPGEVKVGDVPILTQEPPAHYPPTVTPMRAKEFEKRAYTPLSDESDVEHYLRKPLVNPELLDELRPILVGPFVAHRLLLGATKAGMGAITPENILIGAGVGGAEKLASMAPKAWSALVDAASGGISLYFAKEMGEGLQQKVPEIIQAAKDKDVGTLLELVGEGGVQALFTILGLTHGTMEARRLMGRVESLQEYSARTKPIEQKPFIDEAPQGVPIPQPAPVPKTDTGLPVPPPGPEGPPAPEVKEEPTPQAKSGPIPAGTTPPTPAAPPEPPAPPPPQAPKRTPTQNVTLSNGQTYTIPANASFDPILNGFVDSDRKFAVSPTDEGYLVKDARKDEPLFVTEDWSLAQEVLDNSGSRWTKVGDMEFLDLDPVSMKYEAVSQPDGSVTTWLNEQVDGKRTAEVMASLRQREPGIGREVAHVPARKGDVGNSPLYGPLEELKSAGPATEGKATYKDGFESVVSVSHNYSKVKGPTGRWYDLSKHTDKIVADEVVQEGNRILNQVKDRVKEQLRAALEKGPNAYLERIVNALGNANVGLAVHSTDLRGFVRFRPDGGVNIYVNALPLGDRGKFIYESVTSTKELAQAVVDNVLHEATHTAVLGHGKSGEVSFDSVLADVTRAVAPIREELASAVYDYYKLDESSATSRTFSKKFDKALQRIVKPGGKKGTATATGRPGAEVEPALREEEVTNRPKQELTQSVTLPNGKTVLAPRDATYDPAEGKIIDGRGEFAVRLAGDGDTFEVVNAQKPSYGGYKDDVIFRTKDWDTAAQALDTTGLRWTKYRGEHYLDFDPRTGKYEAREAGGRIKGRRGEEVATRRAAEVFSLARASEPGVGKNIVDLPEQGQGYSRHYGPRVDVTPPPGTIGHATFQSGFESKLYAMKDGSIIVDPRTKERYDASTYASIIASHPKVAEGNWLLQSIAQTVRKQLIDSRGQAYVPNTEALHTIADALQYTDVSLEIADPNDHWGYTRFNPDGSAEIYINGLPLKNTKGETFETAKTVREYAATAYSTLLHEMVHLAYLGHGESGSVSFDGTLADLVVNVKPLEKELTRRLYEYYSEGRLNTSGRSFSPKFDDIFDRIEAERAQQSAQRVQEHGTEGQAAAAGRAVRGGRGGTNRWAPLRGVEVREGGEEALRDEQGARRARESTKEDDVENYWLDRGDFGRADPDYAANAIARGPRPDPNTALAIAEVEREPLDEAVKVEVDNAVGAARGAKVSKELLEEVKVHSERFFRILRQWETLPQLVSRFPNFEPLQRYASIMRELQHDKTKYTLMADQTIKELYKVGVWGQSRVFRLAIEVADESVRRKSRLPDTEVAKRAKDLGLSDHEFEVYKRIDSDFRTVLGELKKAHIQEAMRLYGTVADPIVRQINKEYSVIENRNFFPTTRFGRHAVIVKATEPMTWEGQKYRKGSVVYFGTEEGFLGGELGAEMFQRRLHREMEEKFQGQPVEVTSRYLRDTEGSLLSMPPSLVEILANDLNLNAQQVAELKQLAAKLSPGRGFVKHMLRKRGIAGFGGEGKRAYADYMLHAANHIAKLLHRADLEEARADIARDKDPGKTTWAGTQLDRDYLAREIEKRYKLFFEPGNEHGLLRAFIFPWFFAFSPRQAVMNLTQVPIYLGPYLAKTLGDRGALPGVADARAAFHIMKAMKTAASILDMEKSVNLMRWKWNTKGPTIPTEIQRLWQIGTEQGWLDESFATELAAAAQAQSVLAKVPHIAALNLDYRIRRLVEASTRHFKLSEDFNRLTTSMSAFEVARKYMGMDFEGAVDFARKAVEDTMGEYARWARPSVMSGGWRPAVFTFKMFLQMNLNYILRNKGGWRFWAGLLAIGGYKALPGYNELESLINLGGTKVKELLGLNRPLVDIESEIREAVNAIGLNPDLVANGLARYGFGLSFLPGFPKLDYAASVQLNKIVPGVEPLSRALLGQMTGKDAVVQALGEIFGVGAATGMQAMGSLFDPRTGGTKAVSWAYPRVVRDVARAYNWVLQQDLVNHKGEQLVDFDAQNPLHQAGLIGRALMHGLLGQETELGQRMEANWHEKAIVSYYMTRRELLLTRWALAYAHKDDREELAACKKEFMEFNKTAPREFRISAMERAQAIRERVKNQKLDALGLPTVKRYRQLMQTLYGLYGGGGTTAAPSQPTQ